MLMLAMPKAKMRAKRAKYIFQMTCEWSRESRLTFFRDAFTKTCAQYDTDTTRPTLAQTRCKVAEAVPMLVGKIHWLWRRERLLAASDVMLNSVCICSRTLVVVVMVMVMVMVVVVVMVMMVTVMVVVMVVMLMVMLTVYY